MSQPNDFQPQPHQAPPVYGQSQPQHQFQQSQFQQPQFQQPNSGSFQQAPYSAQPYPQNAYGNAGLCSRLVAGLLGIFLGGLGIHRFYLGFTSIGVAQIIVSIFTLGIGSLWSFIEGIMILAKSASFMYDAQGRPLAD